MPILKQLDQTPLPRYFQCEQIMSLLIKNWVLLFTTEILLAKWKNSNGLLIGLIWFGSFYVKFKLKFYFK